MRLDLKRLKSFKDWDKTKILVIHMETKNLDVESCLKMSYVPFYSISYHEKDLKEKIDSEISNISGIIITGSRTKGKELPDLPHFMVGVKPILGLCYGNEWACHILGGKLSECNPPMGEYSEVEAVFSECPLFNGIDISESIIVTMAHNYMISELPEGCDVIASTRMTRIAGFQNLQNHVFGLQFHPEKGFLGEIIFKNFYDYCNKQIT